MASKPELYHVTIPPALTGSMASRIMPSKRKSSVFQRRVYPTCGSVDFMGVRKGRSFLEPLLRRANRDASCQRINGLSKRGRSGRLGYFTNFTFTTCVVGSGALPPAAAAGRASAESYAAPTVYTTDFVDRGGPV